MASKKRFSYQWRLFIPLICGLWLMIFGMAAWQVKRERALRNEMTLDQLTLVGDYVASTYESRYNPARFYAYLDDYFNTSNRFDFIRFSVYDNETGRLIYNKGVPFNLPTKYIEEGRGIIDGNDVVPPQIESDGTIREYYFNVSTSADKRYVVYTMLTANPEMEMRNNDLIIKFWFFIGVLCLIVTVVAYYSTRYIGRGISLLRDFAIRANNDVDFVPNIEFPPDDLGDVSRMIVNMYRARAKDRKRREKEHQVALHALEEKARLKRQLTNNISHELKTPIGIIKGYLDTIEADPEMPDKTRNHFLAKARENVERMQQLVAEITTISRLEDGKGNVQIEEVDFHELVFTHANDSEESGLLGDLEFVYDVPLGCKVIGNTQLLSSMLMNLTKNAALYSHGTECGIRMVHEDETFYHFEFYDNGIGVSTEHLAFLFERFYRVSEGRDRKTGGTGLGLPIVLNTITFLGGTITVSNRSPHGLMYKFTLRKYTPENLKYKPKVAAPL